MSSGPNRFYFEAIYCDCPNAGTVVGGVGAVRVI